MKQKKEQDKANVLLGGVFAPGGTVVTTLDFFSDMVILNVLCILCSLPMVTVPASLCAAFHCTRKLLRGEGSSTAGMFFDALRASFRRVTLPGMSALALTLLLATELRIARQMPGGMGSFFRVGLGAALLLWLGVAVWLIPAAQRFEKSWKGTIMLSAALAIANLPVTVLMLAPILLPVLLSCFVPGAFGVVFLLELLMLVEGAVLVQLLLSERVFAQFQGE